MKILARILVLFSMLAFFANASAAEYIPIQGKSLWSFGIDATCLSAKPQGDFSQVLNRLKLGTSVYLASRFKSPFGFELGYNWTDRTPREFVAPVGTTAFGSTATVATIHTGKIRFKNTYFDLHAHLPMGKFVEAKFVLGVGFVRQAISFSHHPGSADVLAATLDALGGRTAITGRVGIGAQAMVSDHTGLRFILMYETMSHIRVRDTKANINHHMLHNSVSAVLGIYWTFSALNEKTSPGYKAL